MIRDFETLVNEAVAADVNGGRRGGVDSAEMRGVGPDFSVAGYRDKLRELDEQMRAGRPFMALSTRHLIDAQRIG